MSDERVYPVSREYLLNIISDIIELQNGKETGSDTRKGRVCFSASMYGFRYEYIFTVLANGSGCSVKLQTNGEMEKDKERVSKMFALMESFMPTKSAVERNRGHA